MRIAVINSSYYGMKPADRIYNLGVKKIANYHLLCGDQVYSGNWLPFIPEFFTTEGRADKYYFSVTFTWDIPRMLHAVNQVKIWGKQVEIGGPAATFMHNYIFTQTGIKPHIGLDSRFELIPGRYDMTFSSRGCPHHCKFCGVSRVEPDSMEYEDYPLAPIVGDNNILATSWEHQVHFVKQYQKYGREVDINSGFDVRFFKEKHFELYSRLKIKTWRFAFDSLNYWDDVWRVAALMRDKGFDRHRCQFYCLIGFPGQTPEEARFRLDTIRNFGHQPYPMRFIPLNSLSHKYVAPGWSEEVLLKMQTYYQNPSIWKTVSYEDFQPGKNKQIIGLRQ
jgi:hypothetical protein